MKLLEKCALFLAFITLFSACKYTSASEKALSDVETRKEIITAITNSNEMMNEMMEAILNSNNAKMVMQKNEKMIVMMMENRDTMMKTMMDNPIMMQYMMADMMKVCQNDSTRMSEMCKTMMQNQPMMDMMQEMKGEKMDMNKMEGMKHKM